MLSQRRSADLPAAKPRPLPVSASQGIAPSAAPPSKRKLSFKEKHALETLPQTIETMNAAAAALEREIADPDLYRRNRARFETATRELGEIKARVAAAEDEWLTLELLRAELGT
jgi:ATP-binding cassette subfamily F protein uup